MMALFLMSGLAFAQEKGKKNISGPVEGYGFAELQPVEITAKAPTKAQKRAFEKKKRKFNKLRYNVMKVLPYANEAAANLVEINAAMANMPDKKTKRKYMKEKENALFGEYEDDIRKMSSSQGKVLIKLIDRQTGQTTYQLVKDLKNPAAAFFWHSVGKIFGYNLKDDFSREEDFQIELIVQSIEKGINLTYYDYLAIRNN